MLVFHDEAVIFTLFCADQDGVQHGRLDFGDAAVFDPDIGMTKAGFAGMKYKTVREKIETAGIYNTSVEMIGESAGVLLVSFIGRIAAAVFFGYQLEGGASPCGKSQSKKEGKDPGNDKTAAQDPAIGYIMSEQ